MGYYSDVLLCMKKTTLKEFLKTLSEISEKASTEDRQDLIETLNRARVYQNWGDYALFWQYVKWYDWFFGVEAIMKAVENLDSEDYWFGEIGEECSDVTERGCLESRLNPYVSRKFEFEFRGGEHRLNELFQFDKMGVRDE